jgi:ABC-type nickel/cobalt efflux system permease component RcnA
MPRAAVILREANHTVLEQFVALQRWLYQGLAAGMGEAADGGVSVILLATAVAFGALHASMPGHGKMVLASYHASRGGPALMGFVSGSILVVAHVGSAIVLVLFGLGVVRASLGRSDQTIALEIASATLISAIGAWLLWKAVRGTHRHQPAGGNVLAFATGLVPCPLTAFIMTYAVQKGMVALGLIMVVAMAFGMIATIGGVAALSVIAGARLSGLIQRGERWRLRLGKTVEIMGAAGIIVIGVAGLLR